MLTESQKGSIQTAQEMLQKGDEGQKRHALSLLEGIPGGEAHTVRFNLQHALDRIEDNKPIE